MMMKMKTKPLPMEELPVKLKVSQEEKVSGVCVCCRRRPIEQLNN